MVGRSRDQWQWMKDTPRTYADKAPRKLMQPRRSKVGHNLVTSDQESGMEEPSQKRNHITRGGFRACKANQHGEITKSQTLNISMRVQPGITLAL